jgi:hypothetical protein
LLCERRRVRGAAPRASANPLNCSARAGEFAELFGESGLSRQSIVCNW